LILQATLGRYSVAVCIDDQKICHRNPETLPSREPTVGMENKHQRNPGIPRCS